MLAKYGLVLLTLIFGAITFGAGLLAPESLKQGLGQMVQVAKQKLAPLLTEAKVGDSPHTIPAPAPPSSNKAVSSTAAVPLPAASLLLSTIPAASTTYTLQAAQFSTAQQASQLASSIRAQGVPSAVVLMADPGGTLWSVVTVGQFNSPDEALSQRNYLSTKLGLPPFMRALALPPPPAKPGP